jgi:hypothetical protein
MNLKDAISPSDVVGILADKGINISERGLRERAVEIGAFRRFGKSMFFMPTDIEKLMEPKACQQRSPKTEKGRKSGTSGGQSRGDDLSAARERLQGGKRNS